MTIRELADEIHFSKNGNLAFFCQKNSSVKAIQIFKFKLKNYLSERKTAQPKSLDETMLIHFFATLIRRIIRRTDCSSCGITGKKNLFFLLAKERPKS